MPACSGDVTGRGSGRGGPMVMSARTRTRWAAEQRMADGKRERPGRGVCTTRRRAPRSRGKRMKRDGAHVSDILRNAAAVQALAARRVKRRSSTRGESDDSTRLTAVPPLLALSLAGPWLRLVEAAAQYVAPVAASEAPARRRDHEPVARAATDPSCRTPMEEGVGPPVDPQTGAEPQLQGLQVGPRHRDGRVQGHRRRDAGCTARGRGGQRPPSQRGRSDRRRRGERTSERVCLARALWDRDARTRRVHTCTPATEGERRGAAG
ncbi:hypothetical protein DMC30DRAFT_133988 [Rhodotorula diobovata]|uniref:Uncharacterized protein n=1 Tax=Rhodotorula diobovata TaxID=5288 RepID=A0A5C5G0B8_9BASI|nr:hypothetical protein DMC30DRAFT_133988 [Rhodotorula diobovata]